MLEISAKMFFVTRFLFRLIGSRIWLDVIPLFLSQTDVILILLLSEKLTRNQKLFAAIANMNAWEQKFYRLKVPVICFEIEDTSNLLK